MSAVILGACREGAERRAPDSPPVATTPAEHEAGEVRYGTFCAGCHGLLAAGTAQGPPLVHPTYRPSHHADAAFQRAIAFGVRAHHWNFGDMPAVEGVAPADASAIIGYVRWLQRQAGVF